MQSKKTFQVVLLGGPGVGKTLLMHQFAGKPVDPKSLKPTETYESLTATAKIDGIEETFTISTISGKKMAEMSSFDVVKKADAVIFVLDINDYKTLSDTEIYFYELAPNEKKIPSFIIANKNDVPNDAKFPFKEVQDLTSALNIQKCYLTSGLDKFDLPKVFADMANILKKDYALKFPAFNSRVRQGADKSNESGDESCRIF